MRWLLVGFVLVFSAVAGLTPAQAQVQGRWSFAHGNTRLYIENRAINGLTPPSISANVTINESSRVIFHGTYRQLVWEGRWYFYGGRAPLDPVFRPCLSPHTNQNQRETLTYGTYRVTFNAAENRFEGVMTRCRATTGQEGYTVPLIGTRDNTYTASGQADPPRESREIPAFPVIIPAPTPPAPTPEQEAAMALSAADRECIQHRDSLQVAWSQDFATHPCIYNFPDELEIITRTDQTQRPVTVRYQAFHLVRGTPPVRLLRQTLSMGLPFQGVPQAGHRYRVRFPGAQICTEWTWLVSLVMSDGTETQPIGMIRTGSVPVPLLGRGCNPGIHEHTAPDWAEEIQFRFRQPSSGEEDEEYLRQGRPED